MTDYIYFTGAENMEYEEMLLFPCSGLLLGKFTARTAVVSKARSV